MSKKHRHRHRCEEELECIPQNNAFKQNSTQGVDDSAVAFLGLIEMLGSQFNLFDNNKQHNNEDLSSNVKTEDENNIFNDNEQQEVLNTGVDDNIEHDVENIIEDVEEVEEAEYVEDVENETEENTIDDIKDSNVTDIYVEDTENDNMNSTENIEVIENLNDSTENIEEIENLDDSTDSIEELENLEEISNINDIEPAENQAVVHCKSKVSNTTVLECCPSKNIKPKFIKKPVVCKLPVIISQIEIPICIETLIKFNEPAFKIIDINKDVFLESCNFIDNSNKFFIKGFIRENIIYSNINFITDRAVSGNVKSLETDIPFKCSTKIYFNISPILNNEIYCKMDSINILEIMNKEELKDVEGTLPKTYTFKEARKKIILNLKVSLLQEQYVFIDK